VITSLRRHSLFTVSVSSLVVAFLGASSAALTRVSICIAATTLVAEYLRPNQNARHLFAVADWNAEGEDLALRLPLKTHRVRSPTITVFERDGGVLREVMCENRICGRDEVLVLINRQIKPFEGELHLS
jgi:hypothetical protein